MSFENTVSIDIDLRLSIVKSVFDCRLPSVNMVNDLKFIFFSQIENKNRSSLIWVYTVCLDLLGR